MKYWPRFFQTVCVYSVLFSFLKVERGMRLHQHRCSKIFRLAILVLNNPKSWLFHNVVVVQKTAKKFTEESVLKPAKFFWAIKPLFFWRSRYRRRSCLARSLFQCYTNNCWFQADFSRGVRILVHPPEAKGSYESDWTIIYLFFFLLVSADAFFKASISLIPEVPRTIGKSGGSVLSCYPLLISPDS